MSEKKEKELSVGQEAAEIKKIAHDIVFECQTRAHIGTDRLENLAAAMIDEGFDKIVSERGMVSGEQYAEIHRIAVEKDRLWSEACNERNALLRERVEQLKPWRVIRYRVMGEDRVKVMCGEAEIADGSNVDDLLNLIDLHNAALPVHKTEDYQMRELKPHNLDDETPATMGVASEQTGVAAPVVMFENWWTEHKFRLVALLANKRWDEAMWRAFKAGGESLISTPSQTPTDSVRKPKPVLLDEKTKEAIERLRSFARQNQHSHGWITSDILTVCNFAEEGHDL